MSKTRSALKITISILLLALMLLPLACSTETTTAVEEAPPKLKVVTTTSLIASIVEAIGEDKVEVVSIIPPAQCPGHFDIGPAAVQMLAEGDLFLMHGWQGEVFTEKLIKSANNPNLAAVVIKAKGNWMTPPVQAEATQEIAVALSEADPENRAYYEGKATELQEAVQAKGKELKTWLEASGANKINVICAEMQLGFVKWAGFNVVGSYGRPEDLAPQAIKALVDKAREVNVALVIDNLQSGVKAGQGTAEEIGAEQVTISNFPGGFPNTETWAKAIEKNVNLLLGALERCQEPKP